MGMQIGHDPDEKRLYLTISGNFDLSQTSGVLDACSHINDQLASCVIDCSRVESMSDTGRVLLIHIMRLLDAFNVELITIGKIFQTMPGQFPYYMPKAS